MYQSISDQEKRKEKVTFDYIAPLGGTQPTTATAHQYETSKCYCTPVGSQQRHRKKKKKVFFCVCGLGG